MEHMASSRIEYDTTVTEDEKKLSLEEKLALIDNELQTIYDLCAKAGFSPYEIEKCARPLTTPLKQLQRKLWINRALLIGFVLVAAFALLYYDHPIRKFIFAVARLSAIKVLPFWDWSKYYNSDCLIRNPYYRGVPVPDNICENCENFTALDKLAKADSFNITENYMKKFIPFIVTDALSSWPASEKFSVEFLSQLYETDEVLMNDEPCFVKSNIRLKKGQHRALLKKSADGKIDNWFMFWDNCKMAATKVFRQFYRRPYFLPNAVEATGVNWILTVKNYEAKNYKPFFSDDMMTWFAQIKGTTQILLDPVETCYSECQPIEFTLTEGELLVVMNDLWFLRFMPKGDGESIAMATGGNFDMLASNKSP